MQKKYFYFGLGTGIIIMCLVFYFLYNFEMKKIIKDGVNTAVESALDEEEIKAKARDLGMAEISEISSHTMTDDEIIQKAEALGMVWQSANDATDTTASSEGEAAEMAATETAPESEPAGMAVTETAPEGEPVETAAAAIPPEGGAVEMAADDTQVESGSQAQQAVVDNADPGYVTVTIPRGVSSTNVARTMYDLGLINDQRAFIAHIADKGLTRSITAGRYQIRKGADFDEILGTIVVRR